MPTIEPTGESRAWAPDTHRNPKLPACWPHVRVESVRLQTDGAGTCARALVQLGGLTPADVRVELVPTDPIAGTAADPLDERRMFSIQSLDNGCFVFDALIPATDTAKSHGWMIHVHPAEGLHEPRVEYRFHDDVSFARTDTPKP